MKPEDIKISFNSKEANESLTQMYEYYNVTHTDTYMYGDLNNIDASQIIATEDGYKVVDIKLEK